MGRIQKKKDPERKKAQRIEKTSANGSTDTGNSAMIAKPATAQKRAPVAAKPKAVGNGDGVIQKSMQFLREVKVELKKVTWPTRKQTMGSTIVVIVLVMVISMFLGVVDLSLSSIMRSVLP